MEREITTHHDGHGLNESIKVKADEAGPGGASHRYELEVRLTPDGLPLPNYAMWAIEFQKGPRNVEGSRAGITESALLAIVRDRLEAFQAGEFACVENREALFFVTGAMEQMKKRADKRAERGVLGTYQK